MITITLTQEQADAIAVAMRQAGSTQEPPHAEEAVTLDKGQAEAIASALEDALTTRTLKERRIDPAYWVYRKLCFYARTTPKVTDEMVHPKTESWTKRYER